MPKPAPDPGRRKLPVGEKPIPSPATGMTVTRALPAAPFIAVLPLWSLALADAAPVLAVDAIGLIVGLAMALVIARLWPLRWRGAVGGNPLWTAPSRRPGPDRAGPDHGAAARSGRRGCRIPAFAGRWQA